MTVDKPFSLAGAVARFNRFLHPAAHAKMDRLDRALELFDETDFSTIEITSAALGFASDEEREQAAAARFKVLLHSNLRYAKLLQERPCWLRLRFTNDIVRDLKHAAYDVSDPDLRYALLYRAHELQFYR